MGWALLAAGQGGGPPRQPRLVWGILSEGDATLNPVEAQRRQPGQEGTPGNLRSASSLQPWGCQVSTQIPVAPRELGRRSGRCGGWQVSMGREGQGRSLCLHCGPGAPA